MTLKDFFNRTFMNEYGWYYEVIGVNYILDTLVIEKRDPLSGNGVCGDMVEIPLKTAIEKFLNDDWIEINTKDTKLELTKYTNKPYLFLSEHFDE